MTDPGAQLVMLISIHARDASSNLFHPIQILPAQTVIDLLSWNRSHKPGSSLKQIGVSKFHAGLFLAGHGMPSKKANAGALAEDCLGSLQNLCLGPADIGE